MFTLVANWKASLTFHQALTLSQEYAKKYRPIQGLELIICPSFEALAAVACLIQDTKLQLGAQNCSLYNAGSHTGQVLATSLREIGVTHALVGHYEARKENKETNFEVACKCERLLDAGIQPIICIGETVRNADKQEVYAQLDEQLDPLFTMIKKQLHTPERIVSIAYEPVWTIGTGMIPDESHLIDIFAWLEQRCRQEISSCTWKLLYGGSVTATNASSLKALPSIQGFLVGGASLDFQNFQNIVSLL